MTDDDPITMGEAHAAGFCAAGQRRWLNERCPEWREKYVTTGMPVEVARELNAALVEQVLKLRRARRGQET